MMCVAFSAEISVTTILHHVLLTRVACPFKALFLHLRTEQIGELLASERFHVVFPWATAELLWASPFATCGVGQPENGRGRGVGSCIIDYKNFEF